jgi:hypothetical protein
MMSPTRGARKRESGFIIVAPKLLSTADVELLSTRTSLGARIAARLVLPAGP